VDPVQRGDHTLDHDNVGFSGDRGVFTSEHTVNRWIRLEFGLDAERQLIGSLCLGTSLLGSL